MLKLAADLAGKRTAERHCLTMRTAKVRCETGEYACLVRDVSTGGAKLQFFHAPPPDPYLYLELQSGALFAIERRWSEGETVGYRFSGPVDVSEFVSVRGVHATRPIRLRLNQPATVRTSDGVSHAMLANLSRSGACIEAGRQFAERQVIRLEIEGLPERLGHVIWRREFAHGIVFQDSISLRELALHVFALQPFPPLAETPAELRNAG
jgi:hypothetical protein